MSRALTEIANYCTEENTFGALLLTGEWGSGKTYLLEHGLPEAIGDEIAMLRVSLFGEVSVESVRNKIKKTYFEKILEYMDEMGDAVRLLNPESSNSWIWRGEDLTGIRKIFAENPSEYIKLEKFMLGRRVVLIFDDLERSHLSQAEALGCINEYCENLGFKTIIVANEEKIQNSRSKNAEDGKKDFLAYSEIKEKIIARTVRLKADFPSIISNVIEGYRTKTEGYVDFLKDCTDAVISLVEDCEIRNIRSLRVGLQDFEVVYKICREEGLENAEICRYLTAFLLFVILAKGGQISRSNAYGYGLNRLSQKYPTHYTERYMPHCLKDWVMTNEWSDHNLVGDIRKNCELNQKTTKPETLIRSMSLLEMDDAMVKNGWSAYLQLAYDGELTLDEYLRLLNNSREARMYEYQWPENPDPTRLDAGVDRAFARICQSDNIHLHLNEKMEDSQLRQCTPEEKALHGKILKFVNSHAYLYGLNRNRILEALRSRNNKALYQCRSYDTNVFDLEMATEAADWYESMESNQDRKMFTDDLKRILRIVMERGADRKDENMEALLLLRDRVRTIAQKETDMPLRAITTRYFLRMLKDVAEDAGANVKTRDRSDIIHPIF